MEATTLLEVQDFNGWYGSHQVLKNIQLSIKRNRVTAFIGPSGCGKTTLLRSLNRLNDRIPSFRHTGTIQLDGWELTAADAEVQEIRKKIGMVFQAPNPFPMSIYENMRLPVVENRGKVAKMELDQLITEKLKDAALYEEVKDKIHLSALRLSGGQQQRLCIARALTIHPEVILFDEPCSSLDPISTAKIEELILGLKEQVTVIIVTHNIEQARRIADEVCFFYHGEIIEQGEADKLFTVPETSLLEHYLTGKF